MNFLRSGSFVWYDEKRLVDGLNSSIKLIVG